MKRDIILVSITLIITLGISLIILSSMGRAEAEIVIGDANGMNPGVIEAYAGSTAPEGYLLCNGQAVSRTTYAYLYAKIGTTYGAGDGSTTFNIPNLNGKVVVGKDSSNFSVLGGTGGSINTTLTSANMPAHTHTVTAKGTVSSTFTGSSGTTSSSGAHTHGVGYNWVGASGGSVPSPAGSDRGNTAKDVIDSAGAHTHTVTAKGTVSSTFSGSATTTSSTGSGTSFTNLQPYIVVNYIIKY